ncbi:Octicosapeptide/Phox/Bem1p family protein [Perilla frutescens var. hirtella]|uniref:Octicosapeptide/Phox/Bem1p family protein n=1 Tax=Perilla frutescens var. hirtella TaxID=608512 RepID=A0AAD4IND4_PERFH|nr:Octicosapeptide/Phox/Bem1p family protein [Perilla frutescens var. hirtella]
MESQPPPPSSTTTTAATSPRPPIAPPKIRLMCSYGGHIVPRPHDKSLYYAGGETRIVAVDRRTTAASLAGLSAHFSRTLFGNRPFLLKYQLPDEDLDSLISVITDEDLANMLEEHDRISPPSRIRLFLFAVKPESVGSALLDPKSESWFCDALKSTGILQKGQSADCGLLIGIGPDFEVPVESGNNIGGGGGGGESKMGAESLVLETSSSFGSTSSSFSMSNSPPIAVANCDDKGWNLLDRKNRLPSSASIESDYSVGISVAPSKTGVSQEPLIQVGPEESSENPVSDPLFDITAQRTSQVLGYPLSQLPDGKKQQHDMPIIQGGLQYMPQYAGPVPISPYYPVYQMPMHPQHISCPPNQPYPIYLVPVRPTQYHNIPIPCSSVDANTISPSSRPPLHPQSAVINQPMGHKEVFGTQIAESTTKVYCNIPASTQVVSNQSQLDVGSLEHQIASELVKPTTVVSAIEGSEFDEDIAYNQIYKSQPSAPVLPSHYQAMAKGTTMLSEPSVHAK